MAGGASPTTELPSGVVILNVNDNDASRYLVTRMLQRAGFCVIEAHDGRTALEKVRACQAAARGARHQAARHGRPRGSARGSRRIRKRTA